MYSGDFSITLRKSGLNLPLLAATKGVSYAALRIWKRAKEATGIIRLRNALTSSRSFVIQKTQSLPAKKQDDYDW